MAATINAEFARWKTRDVVGADEKQFAIYQIILDSSYPTGGEAVDFTSLAPFTTVDCVLITGWDSGLAATALFPEYDESTGVIKVFEAGADAGPFDEITAADDLSAMTINVLVIGDE